MQRNLYYTYKNFSMIEIKTLSDLRLYSNFEVYHFGDKDIILYDDHRCILTVLFEAKKLGIISDDTNLVSFDLHDDARAIHPDTETIMSRWTETDLMETSSRDFKSFVEFDISEYDDDWVKVGMELGLINNIINIGCEDNYNISEWKGNLYVSKTGKEHLGFVIGHIKDELNPHGGKIADIALHENDRIRELMCYRHGTYPSISDDADFILDFDLDCFTTMCMEKRFAWPESIFIDEYGMGNGAGYFMSKLIGNSKFITICREPSYCGGIGEANKILNYFDRYFFQGCLGTTPLY